MSKSYMDQACILKPVMVSKNVEGLKRLFDDPTMTQARAIAFDQLMASPDLDMLKVVLSTSILPPFYLMRILQAFPDSEELVEVLVADGRMPQNPDEKRNAMYKAGPVAKAWLKTWFK